MALHFDYVPTEAEFKAKLQKFFSEHSYIVHDIFRENDSKRADFLLEDESVRVLLELKIKEDNPDEGRERDKVLNSGGIYEYSESSGRRNRLSALIKKGVSQLLSTPEHADFKLLWLHDAGRYAEHHFDRFKATLYGSRLVVPRNRPSDYKICFYFEDSDFFRYRNVLAGAIISHHGDCQLCINDLYLHADLFRHSSFCKVFKQGHCDPRELEENDQAYIVSPNVNRRNKSEVLAHLSEKYDCDNFLDLNMRLNRSSIRDSSSLLNNEDEST